MIFAHAFIRVLKEGIKFTPYEEAPVVVKQSRLCEVGTSCFIGYANRDVDVDSACERTGRESSLWLPSGGNYTDGCTDGLGACHL